MSRPHPSSTPWLRIAQRWGSAVLEVQHFQPRSHAVTIGGGHAATARVFGLPRSQVPERLAAFVPVATTGWFGGLATPPADFTVSEDAVPPGEERDLVRRGPDGWQLVIEPGWQFGAQLEGAPIDEEALVGRGWLATSGANRTLELVAGLDVTVGVGPTTFEVAVVPPDRVRRQALAARLGHLLLAEALFLGLFGLLSVVALLAALLIALLPGSPDSSAFTLDDRFAHMMAVRDRPAEIVEAPGQTEPEGARARRDEGRVGAPDARQPVARGQRSPTQAQRDREIAESAGLLGALASEGGLSGEGVSADLLDGIGGLIGAKGAQIGNSGLGSRGGGLGSGGSAEGIGGIGTRGPGTGDGRYGEGGSFGHKREGKLATPSSEVLLLGPLDRAQIDAVVKNHLSQVRYCYQRELVRSPSMAGKLTIRFTIAGDGTVSAARVHGSQLGNTAVEQCVVGRFLRMRFPAPRGGGTVLVTYPFVFSGS